VGIGVDRFGLGVGGSISAYFSDPLGVHQVGVAFQGGSSEDLGTLIGGQASYLNRAHRINWGASGLHIPFLSARTFISQELVEIDGQEVVADVIRQVREEVTVDEVAAVGQYPFSLTRRLEASVGWTHYSFDAELEKVVVVGNTVVDRGVTSLPSTPGFEFTRAALAYVGDRCFFGFVSPVRGVRYRFEVESTFGDLEFQTGLADYRRYFFFRPWTIAVRGLHYGRYGSDAEDPRLAPLYVGYGTLVRGYEIGDFDASECTAVAGSSTCPEPTSSSAFRCWAPRSSGSSSRASCRSSSPSSPTPAPPGPPTSRSSSSSTRTASPGCRWSRSASPCGPRSAAFSPSSSTTPPRSSAPRRRRPSAS
jgi:hypothetical protein